MSIVGYHTTDNDKRSSLIKKNIVASLAIKGWAMLVQILLVPLTLSCLGVYENGIWLTIGSVLLWIENLDIGLGNGLRNKLATYMARGNTTKAREMVSSTFAMLTAIMLPVMMILLLFEWQADNYRLFNVDSSVVSDFDIVLMATTPLVCSTFILKFIGNFYLGLQLPAINNLIISGGSTFALIGTYIVYISGSHSLLWVAIAHTLSPLLVYLISYPITFYGKYRHLRPSLKYVNLSAAKELFSLGFSFFALQIAGVILFCSSNFIISHLFSPSMVTPYQIANRYLVNTMTLFTIICVPFWTATTDAYERKDYKWIKKSGKTLNTIILGMALLILLMISCSDFIYNIWIGDKAEIPFSITILVGAYHFIIIWSTRYSFLLNGIGALRLQLVITILAAICYIPLAILASKMTNNINGLLFVMCAINIPGLIINAIQFIKLFLGKQMAFG